MFRHLPIVALDFETYFSTEYSLKLKKYNTSEYIRDPQFKVQCVAIKVGDAPTVWVPSERVAAALATIDWGNSALLAHNACFDGYILHHHFGHKAGYYLDTLSMARALHSNSIRAGLDAVAMYYGVGNKLPAALDASKGVRDLPPDVLSKLGQYCAVDVELCRLIFDKMKGRIPDREFDLIDMTIRMFCDPVLEVDMERAQKALDQELAERERKIVEADASPAMLRSDQQFAELLSIAGMPSEAIPRKWSEKQKKEVWAFAKGDLDFMALKEDPSPRVRALVEGRLAVRSTIGEARAVRFLDAGKNQQKLPVLLNYCGAHTTRWSAGNKMNMQNLKRGGELRKSVLAPPGHVIVACDSSQIEARVLAWLADHHLMLKQFKDWDEGHGPDVYKLMASVIYNKSIDQITKEERFVGKVVVLGAGYGMGADKYEYTLAAGLMGPPMVITNDKARFIIQQFRLKNAPYPKLWEAMESLLYRLLMKSPTTFKVLETTRENSIRLPNGLYLNYPGLEADYDQVNERYANFKYYSLEEQGKKRRGEEIKGKKIYGGLLTENVVQALARVIVADQMLEIGKHVRVVTMTHDEVVCVVPANEQAAAEQLMLKVMRQAPSWCIELPLNAEVESGERYG